MDIEILVVSNIGNIIYLAKYDLLVKIQRRLLEPFYEYSTNFIAI